MLSPEHNPSINPKEFRKQALVEFVRIEIAEFHSGDTSRISTNDELRAKFGYSRATSLNPMLRKYGLSEERKKIKEQGGQKEPIIPSQESAWMIGILAGGGNNHLRSGAMTISDEDESFLQTVKSSGEGLFETRGNINTRNVKKDGTAYKYVSFHKRDISRQLGDLRRDRWPQTIIDKHPWILRDNRYVASFLEGIFDARGLIAPRQGIILLSSYPVIANFLSELLTRLGVENPLFRYKGKDKQKLIGVGIYRHKDIKVLAGQIHSRKSEKEAKLEILRQDDKTEIKRRAMEQGKIPAELETAPKQNVKVDRKIREDKPTLKKVNLLIGEYKKAREISLKGRNRLPTMLDIAELRQQGVVDHTGQTLAIYFGDGSFVRARQTLESILSNQASEQTEVPLPKIRVYARHPRGSNAEIYNPKEKLIEEYSKAREICLRDKNRLPQIYDVDELRDQGIVDYTAHTLAIYFGDRSFVKARETLERIIAEREAVSKPLNVEPDTQT